jgi:preprotein translocase subunit SecA
VAKSELLSRLLDQRGVTHQVLNAKQHFREAEVVAQAGRLGAVTVATNMAGRGVDIILGGNAALLADHEAAAQGLDQGSDDGASALGRLRERLEARCADEGARVRELGGLYVLGSERHESRRIDNQLRGRSGRQGDPGESRFFLSLEDELMRLFATGAMSWVMGRALPEDVPIEAKMVTKAIERAQNTVEARNSEIRKEVLKYDEVMNEQRKVVYARRLQVIDGEDLQEQTEELLRSTIDGLVRAACPSDYPEEWDLEHLVAEVSQYYPTQFSTEDLQQADSVEHLVESLVTEASEFYQAHSESMPGGIETARQIEREVMLQIIDQRWRDHLAEMDYLREGINLRAMGQQDPLVAWQREGFSMFGQLMAGIDDDYLRYVLHVEALIEPPAEPDLARAVYEAADEPVSDHGVLSAALLRDAGTTVDAVSAPVGFGALRAGDAGATTNVARTNGGGRGPSAANGDGPASMREPGVGAPVLKSAVEKVGRNDPCWCGSGKKFKFCHGAA